ncbi:SCO6880 family protein [Frankia sp. BMG5.23]|uniref:SCO6880 family protein n=1 Tax=Frankia sp. BMG5.23 TaxID=683305 RepID=UPI0004612842|nr:SCO6880 family protein [Frankia sp. BMG5.23]KDA41631.1 hypothetical protein BMG523Draft_03569 [Frankia sp. BMG5.23]
MSGPVYHLAPRRAGTALFGASVPQVILIGLGVGGLAAGPRLLGGGSGTTAGVGVAVACLLFAFVRVGGEPLVHLLPVVAGYLLHTRLLHTRLLHTRLLHTRLLHTCGGCRPCAVPSSARPTGIGAGAAGWGSAGRRSERVDLPAVPRSVEVVAAATGCRVPTADGQPAGLVRDRRTGTITVVLDVRGGPFGLLDGAGKDRQTAGWARVLTQFARETPVARLGWTVRSGPATALDLPVEPRRQPESAAAARSRQPARPPAGELLAYRRLLAEAQPALIRHDLRLWLTVRPTRGGRHADGRATALAAAETLADRCASAGLHVRGLLSTAELTKTVLDHADPPPPEASKALEAPSRAAEPDSASTPGLAARAHLPGAGTPRPPQRLQPDSLTLRAWWDAARIGDSWHRVFWIAGWPTGGLRPGWLDPLLHDVPCVRTLALTMTPVPWRVSRRRINSDTVSVDTAVHLRDRHAFRVPVHLTQAHDDIDRRDAELTAGYPEYAYLGLLDVTAPSRHDLDDASAAIVDLAARCGIVDLRPLHGRHHTAWAATLPLGLAPRPTVTGAP